MKAALRKLEKEMSLMVKSENLKFFLNNPNYNCDIYILKIHSNTKLDLMKPKKNRKWKKFFFETYKKIVKENHTISTYTIYIKLILHRIKLKSQNLKRKAIKQSHKKEFCND